MNYGYLISRTDMTFIAIDTRECQVMATILNSLEVEAKLISVISNILTIGFWCVVTVTNQLRKQYYITIILTASYKSSMHSYVLDWTKDK